MEYRRLAAYSFLAICLASCRLSDNFVPLRGAPTMPTHAPESKVTKESDTKSCFVNLGNDVVAVPGQEVVLNGYFSESANSIVSATLNNVPVPFVTSGFTPSDKSDWKAKQQFRFTVPANFPTGLGIQSLILESRNTDGLYCRDSISFQVVEQEDAGNQMRYSWDLRLFPENGQPVNAVPEISVFDVQAMHPLITALFPQTPVNQIPFPILIQPQTTKSVGNTTMSVNCSDLEPGEGQCVAFEDMLNDNSDKNYDLFFAVKAEPEKLTLFTRRLTTPMAMDATDLLFTAVHPSIHTIHVKVSKKRKVDSGSEYGVFVSEMDYPVLNGVTRVPLWHDQKVFFDVLQSETSAKIEVTFQQ